MLVLTNEISFFVGAITKIIAKIKEKKRKLANAIVPVLHPNVVVYIANRMKKTNMSKRIIPIPILYLLMSIVSIFRNLNYINFTKIEKKSGGWEFRKANFSL